MLNTGTKPELSFSITNILKEEETVKGRFTSKDIADKDTKVVDKRTSQLKSPVTSSLPWLAYTRYCPPKIPRSRNRKTAMNRRKVSGSPRVPFSTEQLVKLENSYEKSHYVSAAQASQLSSLLKLPESRIKIWFQNRRAREKKRSTKVSSCQPISETCVEKPADHSQYEEKASKIALYSTNFDCCTRHLSHQHMFLPNIDLQSSSTYSNNNGWCAMLRAPHNYQFNYFDYTLYNGLRFMYDSSCQ